MASVDLSFSSGPADSRFVRILFYLADGAMAGAILYVVVSGVFFLGDIVAADWYTDAELWGFAFLVLVFLAIGLRNALLALLASREAPRSWVYAEGGDTRQWLWVVVVAVPVAVILIGISVRRWGREWFLDTTLFAIATLLVGLLLRTTVRHVIESNAETES